MIIKWDNVKNTLNYEHSGSLFINLNHLLLLKLSTERICVALY